MCLTVSFLPGMAGEQGLGGALRAQRCDGPPSACSATRRAPGRCCEPRGEAARRHELGMQVGR